MRLVLALALLVAIAPLVPAQGSGSNTTNETNETNETPPTAPTPEPAGPVEIVLEGYQEGSDFFWRVEGNPAKNPTITVAPGAQVTFHVKSVTGLHNLQVGSDPVSAVINEGDEADYVWTAPTEPGSVVYICKIHGTAMSGKVQVGEAQGGGGGGDGGAGGIQGESVDLGDLGYADCKGYPIPAIVTRKVTGGPTVSDYVQDCRSGDVGLQGRPAHAADYVIPASFALIALGIVGVVWVHRYYKP